MPKNLFQDMVKTKSAQKQIPQKEVYVREVPEYMYEGGFGQQHVKGTSKYGLWIIAGICTIVFLFALSFFFAKAAVVVSPKAQDYVLNDNLSAIKDVNENGLSYDIVILSGEETKTIATTSDTDVAQHATGRVAIFNNFSTATQKLSKDTNLEGSNGKIYKIDATVSVPGKAADGTPGSIEVGIYAKEAGVEYNSGPLDFKITSFKGTSKYNKFDVKSTSGGAITGGYVGKSPVLSDVEKANAVSELKTELKDKLLKKATDQIPSGFILFKDAVFLTTDDVNVIDLASYKENTLPVTLKGTLYGFLFNEKNLTQKIAKDNITDYDDTASVYIPNIKDLTFALTDQNISFADVQNINFTLTGTAKVVWKFDGEAFKQVILGKAKSDFNQILSEYKNVDSAQLTLSPFWVRTIPDTLKDIDVTVNYPK